MTDTSTSYSSYSSYSSYYILNREYFSECFDESANTKTNLRTYRLALFFSIVAAALFTMEAEAYVAWFVVCLSGVELLAIRYKRSWWITRQMFSRAAGSKVNIRIDDQGIFTDSAHHQKSMLWNDITEIRGTEKGFVISHSSGFHYLSRSGLGESILALLAAKQKR